MTVLATSIFMTSCDNNEVTPSGTLPKPSTIAATPTPGGSAVSFTAASTFGTVRLDAAGVYWVEDFFQGTAGTGSNPHQPNNTYYYDFFSVDGGTASNFALKFGGTANGDITFGSGWTGRYTTTNFSSVTSSTATLALAGTPATFGLNNVSVGTPTGWTVNATRPGWYNYDRVNHVVYPLADNGGSVTLVVTNGSVTYAVEIQDIYLGGIPNSNVPPTNYPYFKFRYKQI